MQTVPVQFFITVLKMVSFSKDFIWYGEELQTFGPRYLKLFVPNVTSFDFGISRFSLYISCVGQFVILSLNMKDYETRINIMESFENFNTQTAIVGNVHGAFP